MATTLKKPKFPKTIGACADLLYTSRQERLVEQKKVDALEVVEKQLKEHIINTLPKSEQSGASGAVANVKVIKKEVPQVEDWEKFAAHIIKTKDLGFLTKALNKAYIEELLESGKPLPPGLKLFDAITVSCTKV